MTTPLRHLPPAVLLLTLAVAAAAAAPVPAPAPGAGAAPAAAATTPAADLAADVAADLTATLATDLAVMKAANPLPVRDDDAVAVTVQPDGTRSVVLDDSYLSTMVVRLGPDGQPVFGCVDSREAFDAFFTPAVAPAATSPEVR